MLNNVLNGIANMPKFCKDCLHYKEITRSTVLGLSVLTEKDYLCTRPRDCDYDLVTGYKKMLPYTRSCRTERIDRGLCGESAQYFEKVSL